MKRKGAQLVITTVAAAAITSIGCNDTNPLATFPAPTPPIVAAPVPQPVPSAIDGVYRVTFTASSSCQLPDDTMRRTYTATIKTGQLVIRATLTDAQFWNDGYCGVMNSFDVYLSGNTVVFSDYGGDCGIIEKLTTTRYLKLWGTAKATESDVMSATFDGLVSVMTPDGSNEAKATASCTASDHQLVFERIAPTPPS